MSRFKLKRAGACFVSVIVSCVISMSAAADNSPNACMNDAMFVFDASGSMGTTDYTRKLPHITRVKQALAQVLPEVPAERRMGLIVYGQGAYNRCDSVELKLRPQTNSGPTIMAEVEKIVPAGRTPLTQSVQDAADVLEYRSKPAVVILMTDGEDTCGGKPCNLALQMKKDAKDLTVHVIGYRMKEAAGLNGFFEARCLAEQTGGIYVTVETTEQLVEALRKTLTCPFSSQLAPPKSKTNLAFASPAMISQCFATRQMTTTDRKSCVR